MLSNLHAVVSKGYLAIDEKHDKLLTSLRTAYAEELNLKKEQTSYSDLLDALRLALKATILNKVHQKPVALYKKSQKVNPKYFAHSGNGTTPARYCTLVTNNIKKIIIATVIESAQNNFKVII